MRRFVLPIAGGLRLVGSRYSGDMDLGLNPGTATAVRGQPFV